MAENQEPIVGIGTELEMSGHKGIVRRIVKTGVWIEFPTLGGEFQVFRKDIETAVFGGK